MVLAGSLNNCLKNASDIFQKLSFVWVHELKTQKMLIFRRCLEIAGITE